VAPFRPGSPPPPSEWIYLTDGKTQDFYPRWSPDGNTVYFVSDRGGGYALLAQRVDPRTKKPLGDPMVVYSFSGVSPRLIESTRWISVARDRIVFSLEERNGSIWMLHL
jgi:Tol biopolymer transport system component